MFDFILYKLLHFLSRDEIVKFRKVSKRWGQSYWAHISSSSLHHLQPFNSDFLTCAKHGELVALKWIMRCVEEKDIDLLREYSYENASIGDDVPSDEYNLKSTGCGAVILAAENDHLETMMYLLELLRTKRIGKNRSEEPKKTICLAVESALIKGALRTAQHLESLLGLFDFSNFYPYCPSSLLSTLDTVVENGYLECMEIVICIIYNNAMWNEMRYDVLFCNAMMHGQVHIGERLLSLMEDCDISLKSRLRENTERAFDGAACRGHLEALKMMISLLDNGKIHFNPLACVDSISINEIVFYGYAEVFDYLVFLIESRELPFNMKPFVADVFRGTAYLAHYDMFESLMKFRNNQLEYDERERVIKKAIKYGNDKIIHRLQQLFPNEVEEYKRKAKYIVKCIEIDGHCKLNVLVKKSVDKR